MLSATEGPSRTPRRLLGSSALTPTAGAAATGLILLTLALTLSGCLAALMLTGRAGASPTVALVSGISVVGLAGAASLASWTRPRNVIGWLLLAGALLEAVALVSTAYAEAAYPSTDPSWPLTSAAARAGTWAWLPAVLLPLAVLPAIFPSGRPASRRLGALAVAGGVGLLAGVLRAALGPVDPPGVSAGTALPLSAWGGAATVLGVARHALATPHVAIPTATAGAVTAADVTATRLTVPGGTAPGVTALLVTALGITAVVLLTGCIALQLVSTAVRVRRASFPLRQQLLVVLATIVVVGVLLLRPVPTWLLIAALTLPGVAMALGVLRRRLPGIAVVLQRAAYYVPLTALVALTIGAVVTLGERLFPSGPLPLLAAAAVVALAVSPVARSLRRGADRLVFGRRAEPTSAGHRVAPEEGRSDDALASVVAAIADMVDAEYVAVESPDGRTLAQYGSRPGPTDRIPLGRTGGALVISHLPDPAGRSMVDALATHVASIVGAQRLTAKLEHSRKRAEASRAAERERIRQDMHDGLGPALSGISLTLQAAHGLVQTDPGAAQAVLVRARHETDAAVAEVRRVLDELRPVAMDGEDLAAAVRHTARSMGFGRPGGPELDLVCDSFRLPARVEDAAYRIVNEALHNVARHADAGRCEVSLSCSDDILVVRVLDDGRGVPSDATPGVGLESMQHRARTAGGRLQIRSPAGPGAGGTLVEARLPVQVTA